jgi:hypothetical protein
MSLRLLLSVSISFTAFIAPVTANGQESCASPVVIPDGSGGETALNLSDWVNDHDGCRLWRPGPDVVFFADAQGVDLVFRITNEGLQAATLYFEYIYWCHPDSVCEADFTIPAYPGIPIVLQPTISQPMYVIVHGPWPAPIDLPLRFNYSLGSATQVSEETWGMIKTLYR